MIYLHCAHPTPQNAPLSYGMLLAYVKSVFSNDQVNADIRLLTSAHDVDRAFVENGVNVLLCSNYLWNVKQNLEISSYAKEHFPTCITIHGGPSSPKFPEVCESFLRMNPHVDYVVRGEGEETLVELLREILQGILQEGISGVSCLDQGKYHHAPDRLPIDDLDKLPSPYLSGVFDSCDPLIWRMLPIETNRGCMYECTFCDWIRSKVRRFDLNRVKAEIEWVARRNHPFLYILDANFGILRRDVEIVDYIGAVKKQYGFPERLEASFAKNTKKYLVDIVAKLVDNQLMARGIIAVQSNDKHTLECVRRDNIKVEQIELLAKAFSDKGIPLAYNLMLGLPGATVESYSQDLRYFFDQPGTVGVHRTVLTPNAPMSEKDYLAEHNIKADDNGYVVSTASMSSDEMVDMLSLTALYNAVHPYHYALFKYPLAYLRTDSNLDVIDILCNLSTILRRDNFSHYLSRVARDKTPWLVHEIMDIYGEMYRLDKWSVLYQEFCQFVLSEYPHVNQDGLMQTVLYELATSPAVGKTFPVKVNLKHDVSAWYKDYLGGHGKPLSMYSAAQCEIDNPSRPFPEQSWNAVLTSSKKYIERLDAIPHA